MRRLTSKAASALAAKNANTTKQSDARAPAKQIHAIPRPQSIQVLSAERVPCRPTKRSY
jgi:hypothetical protein